MEDESDKKADKSNVFQKKISKAARKNLQLITFESTLHSDVIARVLFSIRCDAFEKGGCLFLTRHDTLPAHFQCNLIKLYIKKCE